MKLLSKKYLKPIRAKINNSLIKILISKFKANKIAKGMEANKLILNFEIIKNSQLIEITPLMLDMFVKKSIAKIGKVNK
ncbi:MAG TPA: hypothetical protein P5225_00525 [Candidatus Paceibacterota bacterium]|nr:hypothetical protein [Candidatus Paceibacterota bacterium]